MSRRFSRRPTGRSIVPIVPNTASGSDQFPSFGESGSGTYFGPAQVSNILAWWRGDFGVTTGATASWVGQVANYTISQSTAALQPTFSNTSGPNGTPAWTFTQSASSNSGSRLINTAANLIAAGTTRSVIAVVQATGTPTNPGGTPVQFKVGGGTGQCVLQWIKNGASIFVYSDNNTVNESITVAPDTNAHVIRWDYTVGSDISFFLDGTSETVSGSVATSDTGTTGFAIGSRAVSNQGWNGTIAEVIITTGIIGSSDWTNLKTYFLNRYNITVS